MKKNIIIFISFILISINTSTSQGQNDVKVNFPKNKDDINSPLGVPDEVDVYTAQLKSGDSLTVQFAKNYRYRRYNFISSPTQKRYEYQINRIIEENKDEVPDTVFDQRRKVAEPLYKKQENILKDISLGDSKTAAIFLAGSLKLKSSLPALSQQINYVTPGQTDFPVTKLTGPSLVEFPVITAMLLIGDDSKPFLINIVKQHPDEETRVIAGETIFKMEAGEIENSLDKALKLSSNTTERQNIKKVLERIRLGKP